MQQPLCAWRTGKIGLVPETYKLHIGIAARNGIMQQDESLQAGDVPIRKMVKNTHAQQLAG